MQQQHHIVPVQSYAACRVCSESNGNAVVVQFVVSAVHIPIPTGATSPNSSKGETYDGGPWHIAWAPRSTCCSTYHVSLKLTLNDVVLLQESIRVNKIPIWYTATHVIPKNRHSLMKLRTALHGKIGQRRKVVPGMCCLHECII